MSIKTYAMAVRDTIAAEMRRDEKVFVMGEDVESIGSIFGCTRDLTAEFGRERAFNTPTVSYTHLTLPTTLNV